MNNIVCPVDFSEASLNAVEFATKIASKHGSSIKLLHVYTEDEFDSNLPEISGLEYEKVIEKVSEKLQALSDEINTMGLQEYPICDYEVISGNLIDSILERIEKESASMIVMGTNGAADVREADLGTNTEKIMEKAMVPVLSVPPEASYESIEKVVFASDFDPDDAKIVAKLINFALPFDSRIYVVHISHSKREEAEYNEYVSELKSYLAYPKMSFEQVETKESTEIALEHVLNMHNADMLVMYRKERNILDSLFHRSLTKKMTYLSNFPLMVLKL